MEDLLKQYAETKAKMNSLYSLYSDHRQQIDSLESQIVEKLELEKPTEEQLQKAIKAAIKRFST